MQQARLIAMFSVALLALAISAIPASAWFQATTNNATQGLFHSGSGSVLTGGAGPISCSKASGAWHIESSGKLQGRQKTEQFLTKEGPHLGLTISKWDGCSIGGIEAKVLPCLVQLEQPIKGVNTGTASVDLSCLIEIPAIDCKFSVPATAENAQLATVAYSKAGANVIVIARLTGVFTLVSPSEVEKCEAFGITTTKADEFKGTAIAESVALV
jgi:hypothetical protein